MKYTPSADVGEDVICSSRAGMHIKRLGEDGPYSLNKEHPFLLTDESDRVQVVGRVLGIVNDADYPSVSESQILEDLKSKEILDLRKKYGF